MGATENGARREREEGRAGKENRVEYRGRETEREREEEEIGQ